MSSLPFRSTLPVFQKSGNKSSTEWISRHARDPYVKLRGTSAYRSRSAFKLLEINDSLRMSSTRGGGRGSIGFLDFRDVRSVVDLGAAPGGWSQVVVGRVGGGDATIVAVDLLPISPIPGVHIVQGDFLLRSTTEEIQRVLGAAVAGGHGRAKADVLLSDMAANVSGNTIRDTQASLDICEAVVEFAARGNLRMAEEVGRERGGVLLMKFFAHPLLDEFRKEVLERNFNFVRYIKPDSSRAGSREGYFLCEGWAPPSNSQLGNR